MATKKKTKKKSRKKNGPAAWPATQVEMRAVDSLVPYARNARTHSDKQVDQVAASISEWGWTVPCLVDDEGGMIAGHCRLLAAKKLGITEVPVMVARGWSEAQKRAYLLADNKLAENADWDNNLLRVELEGLAQMEFDLGLTGFNVQEISLSMGDGDGLPEDSVPELEDDPVSDVGQLWALGNHRLLCGDATSKEDLDTLLDGKRCDLLFTDPPYGIAHGSGASKSNEKRIRGDLTQALIPIAFDLSVTSALSGDARVYLCGGSSNLQMYASLFDHHLHQLVHIIIWVKDSFILRPHNYHSQFELIYFGWKGTGGAEWWGDRKQSDVWQESRDTGDDRLHPTQKPVALPGRAITNSLCPGGLVYDPFCGSGTTMIAAEGLNRTCYAMEIDPRYVDMTIKRWQMLTGQDATLESTGQTFEQVSADRLAAAS